MATRTVRRRRPPASHRSLARSGTDPGAAEVIANSDRRSRRRDGRSSTPTGTVLAKYDAARRALAEAKSVDEVKHIRNAAEAVRAYARQAKDRTLEMDAAEIRMRAERRLGQMIGEQKRSVGLAKGGGDKKSDHRVKRRPSDPPTLAEAGIDKHLADRSRKWAAQSDSEFAKHLATWRAETERAKERVTVGVLKAAAAERRVAQFEKDMADKEKDPRRFLKLLDLPDDEDEELPQRHSALELDRQRYEHLLQTNPTAPIDYAPKKYNSIAKIVAEALVRFDVLSELMDQPSSRWKFVETVRAMEDRMDRLLAAVAKATKAKTE